MKHKMWLKKRFSIKLAIKLHIMRISIAGSLTEWCHFVISGSPVNHIEPTHTEGWTFST